MPSYTRAPPDCKRSNRRERTRPRESRFSSDYHPRRWREQCRVDVNQCDCSRTMISATCMHALVCHALDPGRGRACKHNMGCGGCCSPSRNACSTPMRPTRRSRRAARTPRPPWSAAARAALTHTGSTSIVCGRISDHAASSGKLACMMSLCTAASAAARCCWTGILTLIFSISCIIASRCSVLPVGHADTGEAAVPSQTETTSLS